MANYVFSEPLVDPPGPKQDRTPIPILEDPDKWVTAADFNTLRQELIDLRAGIRGSSAGANGYHFLGLGPGGNVAVSPAGGARLRVNPDTNRAEISEDGGDFAPLAGSADVVDVRVFGARADDGLTNNITPFNDAIAASNASGLPLYVPNGAGGEYQMLADTGLTEITSAYIGGNNAPILSWPGGRNGDCVRFRYVIKIENLSVKNARTADLSSLSANIRITNSAYGSFRKLTSFVGAVNNVGVMIEQAYNGSAADGYLLVHIGAWYNRIEGVQVTYLNIGADKGYGLAFYLNPNAIGVTNPTGQPPGGPYTGHVDYNLVLGPNIEGMQRGLYFQDASNNAVHGGQFLGNKHQVYGRNASNNTLYGTKHNQWTSPAGSALNFDSTCQSNNFWGLSFFQGGSPPWQIGPDATVGNTLGAVPTWACSADGIAFDGLIFRGKIANSDFSSTIAPVTYTAPYWAFDTAGIRHWLNGARSDNSGIAAIYADPDSDAPDSSNFALSSSGGDRSLNSKTGGGVNLMVGGTLIARAKSTGLHLGTLFDVLMVRSGAGVLKVDGISGGLGYLWLTSGQIYRPDGAGVAVGFDNGFTNLLGAFNRYNALGTKHWESEDGNSTTTSNASVTDLANYQLPSSSAVGVVFTATARRTGGSRGTGAVGDSARFEVHVGVGMVGANSGTPAILGAAYDPLGTTQMDADLVAAAISVGVAVAPGGLVKFQVTGAANLALSWHCSYHVEPINA